MPTLYIGDDETIEFTLEREDGTPVDITSVDIVWAVARSASHDPILEKSTSGGGVTIVDGPNGRFDVELTATDTGQLADRLYYHEVEITDGNEDVSTVYAQPNLHAEQEVIN